MRRLGTLERVRRKLTHVLHSLRPSPLDLQVDAEWYLRRYPDVALARINPRKHFRQAGHAEGRSPNVWAEHLDREWYVRRYPDVAAQGVDPLIHFLLHGRSEGRRGNAWMKRRRISPEEMGDLHGSDTLVGPLRGKATTEVTDDFDARWYLLRNPELVGSASDPLTHYRTTGCMEGRSPNPAMEPREVWSDRFDATWYIARNPDVGDYGDDPLGHFIHIGLAEGRAPNSGEEDRGNWARTFDPEWYLVRNPDVAAAGLDPLEHFINEGLLERRRFNAGSVIPSRPVTDAQLKLLKTGPLGTDVALFVTHSWDGHIKLHVKPHLESLKREGFSTVLIVASEVGPKNIDELLPVSDMLYHRTNEGFDFAAWAHVLRKEQSLLFSKTLLFCNDSVIGPLDARAFTLMVLASPISLG